MVAKPTMSSGSGDDNDKYLCHTTSVLERGVNHYRKECFKILTKEVSDRRTSKIKVAVDQMAEKFRANIKSELELAYEELNLADKFKKLAALKQEQCQYKGTQAWRPQGIPEEDVEAHLDASYEGAIVRLESMLQRFRTENDALEKRVTLGLREVKVAGAEIELLAMDIRKERRRLCDDIQKAKERVPPGLTPTLPSNMLREPSGVIEPPSKCQSQRSAK